MEIQRRPDACWGVVSANGDKNVVLWSPSERRLHLLNSTAEVVWRGVRSPISVGDLVDTIVARFKASRPMVNRDVRALVDRLMSSELLCDSKEADNIPERASISEYERPAELYPNVVGPRTIGPLCVLGCPMLVDSNDDRLAQSLSSILAPLRDQTIDLTTGSVIHLEATTTAKGWSISRNGNVVREVSTIEQALRTVLAEVNAAPLAVQRTNVVLHAAGAAFGGEQSVGVASEDSLVVFPGVSNAGKSTLVAQLCTRGHRYLTDEAVAIDVYSLEAQPFHKAICVEPMAQTVLGGLDYAVSQPLISTTWDVDPRRIGLGRLADGGPIKAFVFPTFLPGSNTELRPLETLDTLQRLIANAFDFASVGQPAFATLVRLANTVPSYSLEHDGDGRQLSMLENLFGKAAGHKRLAA